MNDNIYTTICVLFTTLIVVGNLIYQKFVSLPVFSLHTFELSVGAILYPLTFLLTDLITEFYGKDKANYCVKLGISMNILISLFITFFVQLEATSWSKVDNATFKHVFGLYGVAFSASVIACYVSQRVDILIYQFIRYLTQGKWLWMRSLCSTSISLFIDTFLVLSIMMVFNILPQQQLGTLIFNSYLFKLIFSIMTTPLFYIMVTTVRKMREGSVSFMPRVG